MFKKYPIQICVFTDPRHETNYNHCHPLPQEHSVQEKDLNRYHHCSDMHADDGKQTLKNNIQPHLSIDPNNDHTEQTNEENSSVPIENTYEIGKRFSLNSKNSLKCLMICFIFKLS